METEFCLQLQKGAERGNGVYRVDKAVRTGLLVLVDLVDHQEHHAHQEGQSADDQQSHLDREVAAQHSWTSNQHWDRQHPAEVSFPTTSQGT